MVPGGVLTRRTLPAASDRNGQKRLAGRTAVLGPQPPPSSVAWLTVGAVGTSLVSWTATMTVALAPLAKVRVTGTGCEGNRSAVKPVSVTLGPPLPIPICTDWRPASSMGVFCEAPDDPVAEPLADAEPLGGTAGEELLAEGEALTAELSVAVEAGPEADPAGEELEPAPNRAPEATVEVTDTNLSAAVPRLMITIRSCASEPLV
jgi:hypothetical protein